MFGIRWVRVLPKEQGKAEQVTVELTASSVESTLADDIVFAGTQSCYMRKGRPQEDDPILKLGDELRGGSVLHACFC